jgi:hypothetical protein
LKLLVGPVEITGIVAREPIDYAVATDEDAIVARGADPHVLATYSPGIDQVVVGYAPIGGLAFLSWFPSVTNVWVKSATVTDLSGLLALPHLQRLTLDRPAGRFDVLGELRSLQDLRLGGWRPGGNSIFRLENLQILRIVGFPGRDLTAVRQWKQLRNLHLTGGKLEDLSGIPPSIEMLGVANARRLNSLVALKHAHGLRDLRLEGCRAIQELSGLEDCHRLTTLVLLRMGSIHDLNPLINLRALEFLSIADGSQVLGQRVDALYGLSSLKTVNITRASGLDAERLLRSNPACKIRLTEF